VPTSDQQAIDFPEQPLYTPHETSAAAYARVSQAVSFAARRLRVRVVLSKFDMPGLAQAIGDASRRSRIEVNDAGSVACIHLTREWGRTETRRVAGKALLIRPTEFSTTYHVITDEQYSFWQGVLGYALRRCYPQVAFPSFTTAEIHAMLRALTDAAVIAPETMRVTRLSTHSRIGDPTAQRETEIGRRYTDLSLEWAFQAIEAQNAALEKIYFEGRNGSTVVAGHIARNAEIGIEAGFDPFREAVLGPCSEIASRRFGELDDRARVREHGFAARPFFIEFRSPVFNTRERQARLVRVLEAMPHASHAVMDRNPYVHVALLDRLEQTSCDVYVFSSSRICVVPQTRSSPTALSRLYEHISKQFGEGQVRDYSEVYG